MRAWPCPDPGFWRDPAGQLHQPGLPAGGIVARISRGAHRPGDHQYAPGASFPDHRSRERHSPMPARAERQQDPRHPPGSPGARTGAGG